MSERTKIGSRDTADSMHTAARVAEKKIEPQPLDGDTHVANLKEAAKAPHDNKRGSLAKGQKIHDGTEVAVGGPVEYRQTPEGNIIVGGPYAGKRL